MKFVDIPIIPNKNITSIRLRMYCSQFIEHSDIGQTIFLNLVNNNWNQSTIHWDNKSDDMEVDRIEHFLSPTSTRKGRYHYFNLDSFIDYIENNTMSIRMSLEKIITSSLRICHMTFPSQDNPDWITQRPTLIIEYDDTRPPNPFTLTSNAGEPDRDGKIDLSWTDSEHANTYSIYQNNTLIESGITAHTYPIEVYIDRSYDFKVIAFNDYGNITSNEITVNVEIIIPQPPTPTPFTLTSNAENPDMDGTFTLYWSNSEYANSYSIYQNNILLDSGLTTLNYIVFYDIGSYIDGKYNFKVIAFNDYGNITSNEITVNMKIPLPERNPFMLTSNADNPDIDGIFMLYWSSSEYTKSYSVYCDDVLLKSAITNLYCNIKVYSSGNYDFKIVAFNDYGQMDSNEITINVDIYIVETDPPEPEPIPEPISEPETNMIFIMIFVLIGLVIGSYIFLGIMFKKLRKP